MNFVITTRIFSFVSIFLMFLLVSTAYADAQKEDNEHVRKWNKFAKNIYVLHKKLVANKKITVKAKKGGYATNKEFYLEKEHTDEQGNLISRIAWEIANPDKMHVIETFVYNSDNKVVRDYSAAYLPDYRNAPVQTLISIHQYNKGLHAFRSFDASGDRILERCEGMLDGVDISFMLDEDELYEAMGDEKGIMYTKNYKMCFDNLQEELGQYISPQ